MSAYDGKTIAEIVHDYAVVRGDLSEQYARDQLVSIIEARIAAASSPAPGAVSDGCGVCFACIGEQAAYPGAWVTVGMSRMIVCETCGNKRCPHGTDHRLECTGSNERGQVGSRYPAAEDSP